MAKQKKIEEPELRPECLWCADYKNGRCEPCRTRKTNSKARKEEK